MPSRGTGRPAGRSAWVAALSATALVTALQLLSLSSPHAADIEPEELYNAGQATALLHGHLAQLWRLQYRDFCGGCSLDALAGAGLFALLEPSWLVWKLVPVGFSVVLALVGFRALDRQAGRPAAVVFTLLLAFPPWAWLLLSLIAWGNHYESGVVGFAVLALVTPAAGARPGRALAGGVAAGLALWIGFSATYAALGGALWLALARRWRRLAWYGLGLLVCLVPWTGQWLTAHTLPFQTIYEPGEAVPSLARLPHKLATLAAPRQLVALFGLPDRPWGWVAGWLWCAGLAGALAASLRRRLPPMARAGMLFLALWLGIYLLVRFQVHDPPWPEIAHPGSARYAAPAYPLLFGLAAALAGQAWSDGRRTVAILVVTALLVPGIAARARSLAKTLPLDQVARLEAVDPVHFRRHASWRLRADEHAACASDDPDERAWHAYSLGRLAASGELGPTPREPRRAWLEGLGEGTADRLDGNGHGGLDVLEAVAHALAAFPDLDEDDRVQAMRAAAWSRVESPVADWAAPLQTRDAATWPAVRRALQAEPPLVVDGAWWALGRKWATDWVGFFEPRRLELPASTPPPPDAFAEGFGYGLGEEWGPRDAIPVPLNLPASRQAALRRGYAEGAGSRWLGEATEPLLE